MVKESTIEVAIVTSLLANHKGFPEKVPSSSYPVGSKIIKLKLNMFLPLERSVDRTSAEPNLLPWSIYSYINMALPFMIKRRKALTKVLPFYKGHSIALFSRLFKVDLEFSQAVFAFPKSISIPIAM